jgi:hypothetical protein
MSQSDPENEPKDDPQLNQRRVGHTASVALDNNRIIGMIRHLLRASIGQLAEHAAQPAAPDISPGVGDHIGTQVAAPGGKPSVKHAQNSNNNYLL